MRGRGIAREHCRYGDSECGWVVSARCGSNPAREIRGYETCPGHAEIFARPTLGSSQLNVGYSA